MNTADLLDRLDDVIAKGQATLESANERVRGLRRGATSPAEDNPDYRWVDRAAAGAFRTAGLSVLLAMFGEAHQHYRDFEVNTNDKNTAGSYREPLALVQTIREQVERGWLQDVRALLAADVFVEILDMADYLLAEGYKDSAAVLVGGSLEGQLRSLANRHGIDVHSVNADGRTKAKKAEALNQELHKVGAYSLGDQKQVTAWLDLRNLAAHAHYGDYSGDQVRLMLDGVRNFSIRVSAER